MTTTPLADHPAKFSDPIIQSLDRLLRARAKQLKAQGQSGYLRVLDPFAGTAKIMRLHRPGHVEITCVEIEEEWAAHDERTICAESIEWMRQRARRGGSGRFDVIATSGTYGNRFADCHDPKDGSKRYGYKFSLGRMPTEGSSAVMPWGPRYWGFTAEAYRAMFALLVPGGRFYNNVSDFPKGGHMIHAVEWHQGACYGAGFVQVAQPRWITTRRMTHGANPERAAAEAILIMGKPE